MAQRSKGVLAMYKEEMREEIKREMKEEMREGIKREMKEEMREEIKEGMKEGIVEEIIREIKEYNLDVAKKLKDKLPPEKIAEITGLSLRTVLSL